MHKDTWQLQGDYGMGWTEMVSGTLADCNEFSEVVTSMADGFIVKPLRMRIIHTEELAEVIPITRCEQL